MNSNIVGYFNGNGYFICPSCVGLQLKEDKYTSVYDINISPYSQDCVVCEQIVVKGVVDTILFTNKKEMKE